MVVIFGWGRDRAQDQGEVVPVTCPNCHNPVHLHLVRSQKRFSLYFVPIASTGSDEYLLCPICSQGIQLQAGQKTAVQEMIAATAVYRRGHMPEDAYRARVDRFWSMLGVRVDVGRISSAGPVGTMPAAGTAGPAGTGGTIASAPDGTPGPGGEPDLAKRLAELGRLHADGLLTDEEFAAVKQRLLDR